MIFEVDEEENEKKKKQIEFIKEEPFMALTRKVLFEKHIIKITVKYVNILYD